MILDYKKEVLFKIDLVNSVLKDLGVEQIFSNKDFLIDDKFHHEHYLKLIHSKSNSIYLEIIFIEDSLQIKIDRTNEIIEWSENYINNNLEEVKKVVRMVLTSFIKVQYCGANYTKLYFYDTENNLIKTIKYVEGFYLKVFCKEKTYSPIYN